ncbi:hypothetical protein LSH36_793g01263 [Paralvinella palmiformis]|uniref:Uncharacterized protein n=1 Tax=Paralvinella palmiformis TaxID=53620 RepID=A0AAD9MU83_9ANNE|nr:hypothetical protein LSH36_793g01263 [Paralvinella palmiformis]
MKSKYIYLTISIALLSYSCNTGISQQELAATVAAQTVTVTYDLNGGTGSVPTQSKGKSEYVILHGSNYLTPPQDESYFKGWSTTATGEMKYKAGDRYTEGKSITLYAVWGTKDSPGGGSSGGGSPGGGSSGGGSPGGGSSGGGSPGGGSSKTWTITYYTVKKDQNSWKKLSVDVSYPKATLNFLAGSEEDNEGIQRTPEREFRGWNTRADGHGVHYGVNDEYMKNSVTDNTFYAEWSIPIKTVEDFNKIESGGDLNYFLSNDINFQRQTSGTKDLTFTGILDGAGHTISGIRNSEVFETVGGNARIFDLTLKDIQITVQGTSGEPVGILAGSIEDTASINKVTVGSGVITLTNGDVGGLVGHMAGGTISDCSIGENNQNDVHIIINQGYAGGLVGVMKGGLIQDTRAIYVNFTNSNMPAIHLGSFVGFMSAGTIIQNNPPTPRILTTGPLGAKNHIGSASKDNVNCNTGISQQELAATVAAQTVTVTYDLNGGTGSLNPKRTQKGTYVTLASGDVLTPPPPDANNGQKKSFLVWSTTQDENSEGGEHYIGGMIYRAEKDLKLYALWGTDVTYEVTFDPNGGKNPSGNKGLFSLSARKYKPLLIPNNINKVLKRYNYPPHSGDYLFNGWNTEKDGRGEHYDRGSYYKMGKDSITLYAEWVIGIDGNSYGIDKMADIIGDSSVGSGSQEHFKLMSSGSQLVEDPKTGTKDFQGIFDGDDFYLRFKITDKRGKAEVFLRC